MKRERPRYPPSEITHRNIIIDEIDDAMMKADKKYVKTLVPLIKPFNDVESDLEESYLSTGTVAEPSILDCCLCCFK